MGLYLTGNTSAAVRSPGDVTPQQAESIASTTPHPSGSTGRTNGIDDRLVRVGAKSVPRPLPDVEVHVVKS